LAITAVKLRLFPTVVPVAREVPSSRQSGKAYETVSMTDAVVVVSGDDDDDTENLTCCGSFRRKYRKWSAGIMEKQSPGFSSPVSIKASKQYSSSWYEKTYCAKHRLFL